MKAFINTNSNIGTGSIIENRKVGPDYFNMSLLLAAQCEFAMPGQFFMIRKQGVHDPLLSRPLSIYGFYQTEAGTVLDFLYHVVGKGTLALSRLNCGDTVEVLGPLGNPFSLVTDRSRILLVAGGIGVAPLSYFLEHLSKLPAYGENSDINGTGLKITFYFGAANSDTLIGLSKIKRFCKDVRLATDDGTVGYHGTVTELLRHDLNECTLDELSIFSCGPHPMIKSLARLVSDYHVPCQVSMEERMACGIGACLGCSIKTRHSENDGWQYRQVCIDGPVFDIRDIIWNDQD